MPSLSEELAIELTTLKEAGNDFAADPSESHSELVCIRSRAVAATFKMLCVWRRSMDPIAKRLVVDALDKVVRQMRPHYDRATTLKGKHYFERVAERLTELQRMTDADVQEEIFRDKLPNHEQPNHEQPNHEQPEIPTP